MCIRDSLNAIIVGIAQDVFILLHGMLLVATKEIYLDTLDADKQHTMQQYEDILSEANDYGIQVIFHEMCIRDRLYHGQVPVVWDLEVQENLLLMPVSYTHLDVYKRQIHETYNH